MTNPLGPLGAMVGITVIFLIISLIFGAVVLSWKYIAQEKERTNEGIITDFGISMGGWMTPTTCTVELNQNRKVAYTCGMSTSELETGKCLYQIKRCLGICTEKYEIGDCDE